MTCVEVEVPSGVVLIRVGGSIEEKAKVIVIDERCDGKDETRDSVKRVKEKEESRWLAFHPVELAKT